MHNSEDRVDATATATVLRCEAGASWERTEVLAVEEPLEIQVQAEQEGVWFTHSVAVTMRTPGDDFHLALGFLFSEGVVLDRSWLAPPDPDPEQPGSCNRVLIKLRQGAPLDMERLSRHTFTSSSCGLCGKQTIEAIRTTNRLGSGAATPLDRRVLSQLRPQLEAHQALFQTTGGLHACGLFEDGGRFLQLREDVGRHNALDKLIGSLLWADALPAENTILLLSGRASFELIQKALFAGIPHVVAIGPPSSLAVDLARSFNITLVGFLRDSGFNVYSGLVL